MEHKLSRKYGLFTAIAMVVGIVIGSGVFFKAQTILERTGGNIKLGILAWLIGGAIMMVCILAFASMAGKYERINGIVDYAEATVGRGYAYLVGWFLSTVYYPTLVGVLAWLSARYMLVFINTLHPSFAADPASGPECMVFALFFLVMSYAMNALSPKLAGHFQVSTTVVKLIPLLFMGIGGVIYGLLSGVTVQNMQIETAETAAGGHPLFAAVVAASFAYDGWIIATSINAELKNAKRSLPVALVAGSLIIIAVYVLYYLGVVGGAPVSDLIEHGASSAFIRVFGGDLGAVLNLFVAVSCIGTLNGLMLANTRGIYSLAARGLGPAPETFGSVDEKTGMPANSSVLGLFLAVIWFLYFYGANLVPAPWFGVFSFDSSELPIVTAYAFYIPIFVMFMRKARGLGILRRWIIPLLAVSGSLFMVFAAAVAHGRSVLYYLIVFAAVMLAGLPFGFCCRGRRKGERD